MELLVNLRYRSLQTTEPVLRRAGGGSEILAESGGPELDLPTHFEHGHSSTANRGSITNHDFTAHGEPHRSVPFGHGFLQPGSGVLAERCYNCHYGTPGKTWYALDHSRLLRRHARSVPAVYRDGTLSDPSGASGGLYRSGNSLRESGSSVDHYFDASFGKCWRYDRAHIFQGRSQRHFGYRDCPPDWDCEEERDHDDRLCTCGGT